MPALPDRSVIQRCAPLLLALALIVLAALLSLRLRGPEGGAALPAEGGRLTEQISGPVRGINPLTASSQGERDLAALVFSGLTRPGPDGAPLPALAESWTVSDDARGFVFTLRRDSVWHDGEPVRVEDVIFTVRLIQSGVASDATLADIWRMAEVTAVSDRRVRVQLPAPFAPLPSYAGFGLLPEHLLRDVAPDQLRDADFNRRPVGAGPFRLVELRDEEARLRRFDGYYLGAPLLDELDLRWDANGAADAAVVTGESSEDRVVSSVVRNDYAIVLLNNDLPLFASDPVRRALSLTVDRLHLAGRTLGGRVTPTNIPFAPSSWAHDGFPPFPPDRDLALSLLASAGWEPGDDGILRRAGREFAFTIVTVNEPARVEVARALADAWNQLGMRITVAPAQPDALSRDFLEPRLYEAALVGWDPGLDPDPFSAWHSTLRNTAGANPANFADQQADELLVQGRTALTLEGRREAYIGFAARFRELAPSIVLYAEVLRYGVRDGIHPSLPVVVAAPEQRYTDVHRWFINTRTGY